MTAALGDVAEGAALLGSVMGVGAQCVRGAVSGCLRLQELVLARLDVSACPRPAVHAVTVVALAGWWARWR